MAKLFRIVANEVPARQLKAANLSQHCFSIHGLEVFLLGLVRTGSEPHLSFDHRDSSVSQADLIAGTDGGFFADSRSVVQIPNRYIGTCPDGGVVAARGVAKERIDSDGGVAAARGVANERIDSAGSVEVPVVLLRERLDPAGGVVRRPWCC